MKKLYIKQKLFSLSGKFTVTDELQQEKYTVEGSFLKIPKSFTIYNTGREEVATITKQVLTWLPKFTLNVNGDDVAVIKKEFTFFKPKYTIEAASLEISGDWWDMSFEIYHQGQVVGRVNKAWMKLADTYEVEIIDDYLEPIVISLVIAIDCVRADQAAASSASV